MMCCLCRITDFDWEEGNFLGAICRTCCVPMIILKEHKSELNQEEVEEKKRLISKYYPDLEERGIGMRDIKDHWHEHLVNEE